VSLRLASIATGLAVLGLLVLALWLRSGDELDASAARVPAAEPAPAAAADDPASEPASPARPSRTPATPAAPRAAEDASAAPPDAADAAPHAPTGPLRVRGRVVDPAGAPLAGVGIGVAEDGRERAVATSDAAGGFEADVDGPGVTLVVEDAGLTAVRGGYVGRRSVDAVHLVVATHDVAVTGRVVDGAGQPLRGVALRAELAPAALAGFPLPLDTTLARSWSATSAADGGFRLDGVPALPEGVLLSARLRGFEPEVRTLELGGGASHHVDVALRRRAAGGPLLEGRVVHAGGEPAAGARVVLGNLAPARADDAGGFRIELEPVDEEAALVAALPGFQPAVEPRFGATLAAADGSPDPVELVLGGPALAITGRVLDAAGGPCAGWTVSLDGAEVTVDEAPPVLAEALASNRTGPVVTDASGAFRLDGLFEREYVVRAWDVASLLMLESEPTAAGTRGLVLRVTDAAYVEDVRGTVVSRYLTPIAGAPVTLCMVTHELDHGFTWEPGPTTVTDEEGRFRFERVPRNRIHFLVHGPEVIPVRHFPAEHADWQRLEIEVDQRLRLRVEDTRGDGAADEIEVRDFQDRVVPLAIFDGAGWLSTSRVDLTDGRSQVLAVDESAYDLLLLKQGRELERVELELLPGEVAVVRR